MFVWASIIFVASTSWLSGAHTGSIVLSILAWLFPTADPRTLEAVHGVVRKLGHFTEYLIFGLLLVRAIRDADEWRPRHAALAVVLAASYAATDELHQHFVPGRTAAATDVLIDAAGAITGQLALAVRRAFVG